LATQLCQLRIRNKHYDHKKAPFEAFSDQQDAVSCSSSIKFHVAYSAFSSSHALRLAEGDGLVYSITHKS